MSFWQQLSSWQRQNNSPKHKSFVKVGLSLVGSEKQSISGYESIIILSRERKYCVFFYMSTQASRGVANDALMFYTFIDQKSVWTHFLRVFLAGSDQMIMTDCVTAQTDWVQFHRFPQLSLPAPTRDTPHPPRHPPTHPDSHKTGVYIRTHNRTSLGCSAAV